MATERVVEIEKMLTDRKSVSAGNPKEKREKEHAEEMIIVTALSKATDEKNKSALKGVDEKRNGLYMCVKSGSKGNVNNFTQLVGALGQQHVAEGRPSAKCLAGGTKSNVFFPKTIKKGVNRYSLLNRGYIEENFTNGLRPTGFFFHAQSGREGIISASLGTADAGYCQRRLVKALEHISIHQDGLVRSPCGNIYQFFYGGQGLNPRLCPIILSGSFQIPLDAVRFANCYFKGNIPHDEKANGETEGKDQDHVILRRLVGKIVETVYGRKRATVPGPILTVLMKTTETRLFRYLKDCKDPKNENLSGLPRPLHRYPEFVEKLTTEFIVAYYKKTVPPLENVGILAAQSASAAQTQLKLDSFHGSGLKKLTHEASAQRNFQKFINATKNNPVKICNFVAVLPDPVERDFVVSALVSTRMIDVVTSTKTTISKGKALSSSAFGFNDSSSGSSTNGSCESFYATFSLTLSIEKMYERKLLPNEIAAKLAKNFGRDATYVVSYPFIEANRKTKRDGKQYVQDGQDVQEDPLVITVTHEITEEEYGVEKRLKKLGVHASNASGVNTDNAPENSFTFRVGKKVIPFKKFLRWVYQKRDYISCLVLKRDGEWQDLFAEHKTPDPNGNDQEQGKEQGKEQQGQGKTLLPKVVEKSILASLGEESTLRFVRDDVELANGPIKKYAQGVLGVILNSKISGVRGVTRVLLSEKSEATYNVYVEGYECLSDIVKAVGPLLPFDKNFRCNCIWDVYETFGIHKTRNFMNRLLLDILGNGVGPEHAKLIVDKMTFRGAPDALSRYSMRKNDVPTMARASFEEMVFTFISSAMSGEKDDCNDAASISILGKRNSGGISLYTTPSKLLRGNNGKAHKEKVKTHVKTEVGEPIKRGHGSSYSQAHRKRHRPSYGQDQKQRQCSRSRL